MATMRRQPTSPSYTAVERTADLLGVEKAGLKHRLAPRQAVRTRIDEPGKFCRIIKHVCHSQRPSMLEIHEDLLASLVDPRSAATFRRPSRIGVESAWYGHVPFGYWLTCQARPRVLVELG